MDTDPFTVSNSEENISVLSFKMIFYQLIRARNIMTGNPKKWNYFCLLVVSMCIISLTFNFLKFGHAYYITKQTETRSLSYFTWCTSCSLDSFLIDGDNRALLYIWMWITKALSPSPYDDVCDFPLGWFFKLKMCSDISVEACNSGTHSVGGSPTYSINKYLLLCWCVTMSTFFLVEKYTFSSILWSIHCSY